jgi:hypothetical protein
MADGNTRKRQRTAATKDIDDDGKKQRGRPRVDGADETAADVSDLGVFLNM